MSSINDIKKGIAAGKEDMLSQYTKHDLMRKIRSLCDTYYVSYLNNDPEKFHATVKMLDDLTVIAADTYPNVNDYVNYCMVSSLNKILNERIPRKYLLFHPEGMSIDVAFHGNLFKAIAKSESKRNIVKKNPAYNKDVI